MVPPFTVLVGRPPEISQFHSVGCGPVGRERHLGVAWRSVRAGGLSERKHALYSVWRLERWGSAKQYGRRLQGVSLHRKFRFCADVWIAVGHPCLFWSGLVLESWLCPCSHESDGICVECAAQPFFPEEEQSDTDSNRLWPVARKAEQLVPGIRLLYGLQPLYVCQFLFHAWGEICVLKRKVSWIQNDIILLTKIPPFLGIRTGKGVYNIFQNRIVPNYRINSSSRYLGNGHNSSSTIISSLSTWWRMSSIFGATVSW